MRVKFTEIDKDKKVERVTLYTVMMYAISVPIALALALVCIPLGCLIIVLKNITIWEIKI